MATIGCRMISRTERRKCRTATNYWKTFNSEIHTHTHTHIRNEASVALCFISIDRHNGRQFVSSSSIITIINKAADSKNKQPTASRPMLRLLPYYNIDQRLALYNKIRCFVSQKGCSSLPFCSRWDVPTNLTSVHSEQSLPFADDRSVSPVLISTAMRLSPTDSVWRMTSKSIGGGGHGRVVDVDCTRGNLPPYFAWTLNSHMSVCLRPSVAVTFATAAAANAERTLIRCYLVSWRCGCHCCRQSFWGWLMINSNDSTRTATMTSG